MIVKIKLIKISILYTLVKIKNFYIFENRENIYFVLKQLKLTNIKVQNIVFGNTKI